MFTKLGTPVRHSLRQVTFVRGPKVDSLSEVFRNLFIGSDVGLMPTLYVTPNNRKIIRNYSLMTDRRADTSDDRSLNSQTDSAWSVTQKRYHWRPLRSLRTPPTKPLHFNYSGDLDMSIGKLDLKEPKLGYENVPELLESDENVRKIFSLEYSTQADIIRKHVDDMLKKVQDHPLDVRSLEVKIAKKTIEIRCGIKHCLRFRNDKVSKAALIEKIHLRKGHLRRLLMQDIDKFRWLEKELRIKFVEDTHEKKPSKAELRRKAARDVADAEIKSKLAQLRKTLETERVKFEKFKEVELAELEKDLKELGVPEEDTTSLERTLQALGHADMMPQKDVFVGRRRLLLQKKFALYAPRKKAKDTQILQAHDFLTPEELSHYTDLKQ